MVGVRDGSIYVSGKGFPMFGAEDVVNAYVDGIFVKRTSDAVACTSVSIREAAAYFVMGIRDRGVVEIAHQDQFPSFIPIEKLGKVIDLERAVSARSGNLFENGTFSCDFICLVQVSNNLMVVATLL